MGGQRPARRSMGISVGSGRAMSAGWRIELLGDFRVTWAGQPLAGFRRQRTTLLLAYLALRAGQGPTPRDVLLEALWPEGDPEASRTNLRTVLHALRLSPPCVTA